MAELKKLLYVFLGLMTAIALTACDVDEEEGDGGAAGAGGGGDVDGGAGGEAGEGGGGGPEYTWVRIVDNTADENMAGTPGVDICGVIADCGGALAGMSPTLDQGGGNICEAIDPAADCSAVRNDPAAANDDGGACDPVSAPTSDYVSLGIGGALSIDYGQDLQGCDITIVEHSGSNTEGYEVYICTTAAGDDCLTGEAVQTVDEGGNSSFTVPSE